MFKKIAATIPEYSWAKDGSRYRRLDLFDRLLDGKFYDHLKYSFYDETEGIGETARHVLLVERRPSAQFRLPRMVARWSARKLFSGRHAPRIRHPDKMAKARIETLLVATSFYRKMIELVYRGSVGSVGATFRVETEGDAVRANIVIWKAKYCWPVFDDMGELAKLRVCYITRPDALLALKIADAPTLDPAKQYWFIRDFEADLETTFKPVPADDWNPETGFSEGATVKELAPWETIKHRFGFVPGHWFKNIMGGEDPDGACTWEDAIPNSIEIDYNLSQIGRGTRYNAAPQPVIVGMMRNSPSEFTRGPATAIYLDAAHRDEDGNMLGEGKASLLEMTGSGVEAGLKVVDKLHDYSLEQIQAQRKDPARMKGPLSGRGMEFMDEDAHDLVAELRTAYGDEGMLPLLRKMVVACYDGEIDASQISLQWPRLYQPTASDLAALSTALATLINPLRAPYKPASAASTDIGPDGQPIERPASDEQLPPEAAQLMTFDEARLVVRSNLDLTTLELEGDPVAEISDKEIGDTPGEVFETAPPALGPEDASPAEDEGGDPVGLTQNGPADAAQQALTGGPTFG